MCARSRHRRGIVNIWLIACGLLFAALTGLAIDTGFCVLVLSQLSAAADAGALAGAQHVRTNQTTARSAAHDFALANKAARQPVALNLNPVNNTNGDIVIGKYNASNNTFTPTTTDPNAVKVTANRTSSGIDGQVQLMFGPAFEVDS